MMWCDGVVWYGRRVGVRVEVATETPRAMMGYVKCNECRGCAVCCVQCAVVIWRRGDVAMWRCVVSCSMDSGRRDEESFTRFRY